MFHSRFPSRSPTLILSLFSRYNSVFDDCKKEEAYKNGAEFYKCCIKTLGLEYCNRECIKLSSLFNYETFQSNGFSMPYDSSNSRHYLISDQTKKLWDNDCSNCLDEEQAMCERSTYVVAPGQENDDESEKANQAS